MGKLTALKVKSAKESGKYTDGKGLMLLVKPTGAKSWVLRTPVKGVRRDFGLGSADDVSLAEAREKADDYRRAIRAGYDPKSDKVDDGQPPLTFKQAAEQAHAERKEGWKNGKHRDQWLSSLATYAHPHIGDMSIADVDGPIIRDLLAPIWLAKPETARRVRQRVGAVLDWAYAKGLRSTEAPMRSVSKGLPRQPKKDNHFAALSYPEAPALMVKLSENESVGRFALQFLILTATRSGEVRMATWKEIDLANALWTIPARRMKAGKEHLVPLSKPAVAILEQMKKAFPHDRDDALFPGKAGKPLSDMTLTKVLRTDLPGDHTVHGFRSTFRDWAAEQTRVSGDVVEAALAHTIANKVEAAYRRTNYLEKRRPLMQEWADYLGAGERQRR